MLVRRHESEKLARSSWRKLKPGGRYHEADVSEKMMAVESLPVGFNWKD